ncbi:MAG TPA: cyclic nucleotide-binding domain-containing protein [bacterium]|nr:cyclic nucleotide-binding domain-containing protein [bacterium]
MPVDLSVFKDAAPYRGLREPDWKALSELLKEVSFKTGSSVFKENDPGDGFYWVRAGKIRISRQVTPEGRKDKQEQLLTVLTAGHIFGEMALVDGEPRSADAIAESDAVLFFLSHAVYEKLKQNQPATALRIQDMLVVTLCSRIREANRAFETIRFWCT